MKTIEDVKYIIAHLSVKPRPDMRSEILGEALEMQRNKRQQI